MFFIALVFVVEIKKGGGAPLHNGHRLNRAMTNMHSAVIVPQSVARKIRPSRQSKRLANSPVVMLIVNPIQY